MWPARMNNYDARLISSHLILRESASNSKRLPGPPPFSLAPPQPNFLPSFRPSFFSVSIYFHSLLLSHFFYRKRVITAASCKIHNYLSLLVARSCCSWANRIEARERERPTSWLGGQIRQETSSPSSYMPNNYLFVRLSGWLSRIAFGQLVRVSACGLRRTCA